MTIVSGATFGQQLCKALGLDPERVRDISLCVPPIGIVTANVTLIIRDTEAGEIAELAKSYELVARESPR